MTFKEIHGVFTISEVTLSQLIAETIAENTNWGSRIINLEYRINRQDMPRKTW
jgi:hypothetical protein